jgi:hypothetical protein
MKDTTENKYEPITTSYPIKKDFMFDHIILTSSKNRYVRTIALQPESGDNNV